MDVRWRGCLIIQNIWWEYASLYAVIVKLICSVHVINESFWESRSITYMYDMYMYTCVRVCILKINELKIKMCMCVCVFVAEMGGGAGGGGDADHQLLSNGLPVDCGVGKGVYMFVCMHMQAWVHVCVGGDRGSDADE